MEKFAVEKESADYTYTITIVDTLPEAEGELLVNRVDLQVFRNGEGLESRLIGVKGEERPYALYRETAQKHAQVFVGRWYLDGVAKYEVVFLSLLALERRLSERPCLILHRSGCAQWWPARTSMPSEERISLTSCGCTPSIVNETMPVWLAGSLEPRI